MKKILTLILLSIIAFNAIHAEVTWTLSDDGTLTISGTDMPNYTYNSYPWYSQRYEIYKVVIENGVTSIGEHAFNGCSGITSVTIPESVTSIGNKAFYGCSYLTSIDIPNSVTNMGNAIFHGCSRLVSVTLGTSVKDIGASVFYACTSLTSVNIPESVRSIGDWAFNECSSLSSINIPESVTYIGNMAFFKCKSLTSVTISCSVTKIGRYTFAGCSSLTSINIPESVISIEEYAFENCFGLTSINIPASVKNIGDGAFAYCSKVSSIICEATFPPNCGSKCFDSVRKKIPLYVPESSMKTYKAASPWNDFTNIQAIIAPESISFANESVKLIVGKTIALDATIIPENTTSKTIIWTSSNTTIATVSSEGIVTANSTGTTVITAKTYNGKTAKCTVTVEQPVTAIALSDATTSLWVGKTMTITAKAIPTTANNTAMKWSSSDNNVATVSSKGVITAKGKGTCIITCTAADGYGAKTTCEVTVKQPVTEITLSETTASLWVGKTMTITAKAIPTTANNTAMKWSSSDNNVATVSSKGVITAKGKGTCIITCTAADGYGTESKCEIIIKQQITSISLSETTVSLFVGDMKTITAMATPATANNTAVKWSSSDDNVATVSSEGLITAKGDGICTITCIAADGYGTLTICEVTVNQQQTSIEESQIANAGSPIYNLKGQRINRSDVQKGVYIINGKKYTK